MGEDQEKSKGGFLGPGLEITLTFVTIVSVLFAAYTYLDYRHAKAVTVSVLDTRLDLKIKEDLAGVTLQRFWKLKDRVDDNPKDKASIEDLREVEAELAVYQEEVKILKAALVNIEQD